MNLAHVRILLYFRLIRDVGPTSALTVAYLIPMFGVFWRVVFLGEPVTPALLSGTALVLLGTTLTTGFALGMLRQALSRLRIY